VRDYWNRWIDNPILGMARITEDTTKLSGTAGPDVLRARAVSIPETFPELNS
jgi:hypothetical protein